MLGFLVRFRSKFRIINVRVGFVVRISVRVKFRLSSIVQLFDFRVRIRCGLETGPGSSLLEVG